MGNTLTRRSAGRMLDEIISESRRLERKHKDNHDEYLDAFSLNVAEIASSYGKPAPALEHVLAEFVQDYGELYLVDIERRQEFMEAKGYGFDPRLGKYVSSALYAGLMTAYLPGGTTGLIMLLTQGMSALPYVALGIGAVFILGGAAGMVYKGLQDITNPSVPGFAEMVQFYDDRDSLVEATKEKFLSITPSNS